MSATTKSTSPNTADPVRGGCSGLSTWLNQHTAIEVSHVTYLDGATAELSLPVGEVNALTAVALAADALDRGSITVTDVPGKGVITLSVTGTAQAPGGKIEVIGEATVLGAARTHLIIKLSAIEPPTNPRQRTWATDAALLREVAHEVAAAPERA